MAYRDIPWTSGNWSTQPEAVDTSDGHLTITAARGSDFWQKTLYDFRHDSGHCLLADWDRDRAREVTFRTDTFTDLYDQAGIMLWHGPEQWVKSGIELTDGVPHLGAVVTDGYSDWSLHPVPEWTGATVTIRASRLHDAVVLRARADGGPWRTLRVARFPYPARVLAGPLACAPTRAGLRVTFTRWADTDPDQDLHTTPPLPS